MSVISDGKTIIEAVRRYKDPTLINQMLEYQSQVLILEGEKREQLDRITELEKALELKGRLIFNAPFYYVEGEETPYCPRCWEGDQKAIHVVLARKLATGGSWKCPVCKSAIIENPQQQSTGAVWGRSSGKVLRT